LSGCRAVARCRWALRLPNATRGKRFFFAKNNQKTFAHSLTREHNGKMREFLFSFKKESFALPGTDKSRWLRGHATPFVEQALAPEHAARQM
jgi:hypothetical protein